MELKLNGLPDLSMVEIAKQLFNNEFLSDIQFDIGDQILYAHSLELMKQSIVFEKQLLLNLGTKKLIPVIDVKYESFFVFLKFMYTDECCVENEDMGIDVLKLSLKYQVIRLQNKIIDWFAKESRILRLYEFCVMENYQIPYNWAKDLVTRDLNTLLAADSFQLLHANVVEEILKFDYIPKDVKEVDLFDAVMRWINTYYENEGKSMEIRDNAFGKLLKLIRFPSMALKEFASCELKIGPLLTNDDYGVIFRQIVTNTQLNDTKWNSICRGKFSLNMELIKPLTNDDRFLTSFTVTNDVLLTGISFGQVVNDKKVVSNYQLKLSSRNTETQLNDETEFRVYTNKSYGSFYNVNSLGQLILLKPKYEYVLQFMYPIDEIPKLNVWSRRETREMLISGDPCKSVQINKAGVDMIEMIFQAPP